MDIKREQFNEIFELIYSRIESKKSSRDKIKEELWSILELQYKQNNNLETAQLNNCIRELLPWTMQNL
jgi:hypothetical protein